ncbi:MAG: NAD(P)/FAD-dependent oxidoreductase [Bacteroidota bacterium]
MKNIGIVGGGLAGLISAILLNRNGFTVTLFERKKYPFHRVCGEYISNETAPFLKREGLYPSSYKPPIINRFILSSIAGKTAEVELDMGGFGISRYAYDDHLVTIAKKEGVEVREGVAVTDVSFDETSFQLKAANESLELPLVIGAFGKRSKLDKTLDRDFMNKRSPFVGVKYHVKADFPVDAVALHNFPLGYCGISRVEEGRYNMCYLTRRENLKRYGDIPTMESEVVHKNPHLKSLFQNSDFLLDQPEVINEISFAPKKLIEDHILMTGDSAGLITPLCGNGMAMAIHSAKLLSDAVARHWNGQLDRFALEYDYQNQWNALFKSRLWVGRKTQNLFGTHITSSFAIALGKYAKPVTKKLISLTHGQSF